MIYETIFYNIEKHMLIIMNILSAINRRFLSADQDFLPGLLRFNKTPMHEHTGCVL